MFYQAIVAREGEHWLAEFPDCPGCQTFASSEAELAVEAKDAVEGWLEAHLVHGAVPPAPRVHRGANVLRVDINTSLAVRVQIRQARDAAKLTQGDLAQRAGVSQQQIAKLERPGVNPSLATLQKVADALGLVLDVRLDASPKRRDGQAA